MQNNLLKHGFLQKKRGKMLIFEKEQHNYSNYLGGLVDEKHIIIRKNGDYFLSEIKKENKIKNYKHFLNIFEYEDKSTYGFVYLILYNGVYKIGMTVDLITRVKFFKNTLPGKVELCNYIVCKNYIELEKKFHYFFKEKLYTKFDREWFKLNQRDLFFFEKVKTISEN